eukprot:12411653-Karenia_brevis.AAC.1
MEHERNFRCSPTIKPFALCVFQAGGLSVRPGHEFQSGVPHALLENLERLITRSPIQNEEIMRQRVKLIQDHKQGWWCTLRPDNVETFTECVIEIYDKIACEIGHRSDCVVKTAPFCGL